MIPERPQGEIPQPPEDRRPPVHGKPPSPLWADMKDELDGLKKSIEALNRRMEGLEGRVSALEESMRA